MPARNGSIPEAPDGGHSSQAGTVLLDAAAGVDVDDDVPVLVVDVVVAGVDVDDDVPALVGAVNVVVGVEVEGVVAVIAGKPAAPPVVTLEPATPAVEAVVPAICAAAGPASTIRNGSAMRNSRVMAPSLSVPHELL